MIDGGKAAEAHGEAPRLDHHITRYIRRPWRDYHRPVAAPLCLRHEGDEGLLKAMGARAVEKFLRRADREHPSRVHRDQQVEARRLLHVGGRDDDAHALS